MTPERVIAGALGGPVPARGAARVLVVDDELFNRDMLARRLARAGYEVDTVDDGPEALEAIERSHYEVVLLDVRMPRMNGIDVLRRIRESRGPAALPVVMLTAQHGNESVVEALDAGANDYVTKPFELPVLLARVRAQCALARAEAARLAAYEDLEAQVAARTAELARSRGQFAAIVDNVPAAVYLKDREGRYQLVNPLFCESRAVDPQDALGRTVADIVDARRGERASADDRAVIERGLPYRGEWELPHPDGTLHTYIVNKVPIRDASGEIVGLAGINSDVTEYRALQEQLAQAQKMEAIGQLTGGVAHDFNNLLTVILGNLQLVEGRADDPGSHAKHLRAASEAAMRGAELTRRLLAFGRRQVLRPRRLDFHEVLAEMTPLLERTLGETIDLEVAERDDTWPVRVDRVQLEQTLLNLVLNARDAMEGDGRIRIELERVSVPAGLRPARYAEVEAGDYAAVSVVDEGSGIAAEIIDQVFEPFFTTKPVGHGTGLGLSMAYGFARQSGGHLLVESEVGTGTRMTLLFPRAAEHTPTGDLDRSPQEAP